jgi:catechol 2,3-dioxygenase-like lactoylglutathione lyase family enzyme
MAETFKTSRRPTVIIRSMTTISKETRMSTPRLDLIGIVVEDMARSLAYYRHLGLDIPTDADTEPHVEVALPGGTRVAWDTIETVQSFDPDYQAPSGSSGIGLAFLLDSPADVDATYEKLVAAGYPGHKAPWDAFWGQRYALIHDPDGNSTDLFAPLAAEA